MFTNRRKRMNAQDDKMMYRLFLTAVEKQVRSKAGPDPTIELGKVLKNNSVEFDTIIYRRKIGRKHRGRDHRDIFRK